MEYYSAMKKEQVCVSSSEVDEPVCVLTDFQRRASRKDSKQPRSRRKCPASGETDDCFSMLGKDGHGAGSVSAGGLLEPMIPT